MPTIPRFHVTQDDAWVFVHVHVPYVRVSEMEFYVDGTHFTFYCKPYLLKLQFPHEVVDDELAKAVYDPNKDHGTIVVHLFKKEPGQHFEDLDMLTKLLQPKEPKIDVALQQRKTGAPLIEVLESRETMAEEDAGSAATTAHAPQSTRAPATGAASASLLDLEARMANDDDDAADSVRITNLAPTYGFNNAYSDFFRVWHGEVSEILSLPDPEHTPAPQRRVLREAAEDAQFDVERYCLDFLNKDDDPYYQLAIEYEPFWRQYTALQSTPAPAPVQACPLIMEVVAPPAPASTSEISESLRILTLDSTAASPPAATPSPPPDVFSDADRELLLRLPHKEFLIAREQEPVLLGGLVDILIGFVYDHVTTQGDSGIESTWTASIVSPTLAWLDTTGDLAAVVRSGVRRILAFPFLRQFDLAMHVLRETVAILVRGKRVVLRALLALYRVVEKSETQYLLNTLYVQDYCVWIQSVDDATLVALGERLATHVSAFTKAATGWALDDMERCLVEADGDGDEDSSSEEEDSSSDDSDRATDAVERVTSARVTQPE